MAKKERTKQYNIYLITCIVTGEQYVGLTTHSLEKRWKEHLRDSKYSKKGKLYDCMRLWGVQYFKVKQICIAHNLDDLNMIEQMWIAILNTFYEGLNATKGGLYCEKSPESVEKSRIAHTGLKHTDEAKNKMSIAGKNRKKSTEHKNKIAISNRKRPPKNKKFKGIFYSKKEKKWKAMTKIKKKSIYLGSFKTEIEAAKAYNDGITKYWGEGDWFYNDVTDKESI